MRHTVSPLLARLLLPLAFRKMFEPAPVPEHFDRLFPKELMLHPTQLRASNEDSALTTPAVMELERHYGELNVPIVIVTVGDHQLLIWAASPTGCIRSYPGASSSEFLERAS